MSLLIREARPDEAGLIVDFICELAEYEKMRHEVVASIGDIERDLFGPNPRVFCDIAEWHGAPAGLALWFYNYSTFRGRHGIYLEDLYVRPAFRGQGIAKALMARLARRCVDEGLGRFEWWVLNWNEPAIRFYRSIGAVPMEEWTVQRVTGAALEALAES
ncbi:GNAT family N-acetyltransferase [Ancylobacter amanitiformis]|uniref:GNAT superfamily N-acetyltransferase n=1 Tax=Ancylobacter amanitiformis TaxID=217069 RepID=A0ABU0LNJ5_9HYPH|nr:GNAT family N-acetyltransferase [Ancylobacter amanitiformis]MDQ0510274.1 GNAT superfamily N-acetyltransferase [Ancylobacter amanitiformis]